MSSKMMRPLDILYDPNYVVSSAKDYNRIVTASKLNIATYAVCPIFPTMFSDMRNYPRKQYVIRRNAHPLKYFTRSDDFYPSISTFGQRSVIVGQDRHKYFHNPVSPNISVPKLEISCFYQADENEHVEEQRKKNAGKCRNVKVQTMYRESSAQTSPWQPDYKVIKGDPELLKLDFLKWGTNLPATEHEVALIRRARKKVKWDKSLPAVTNQKTFEKQIELIETMTRSDWVSREQEIQYVQDLRLALLEKMLTELSQKSKCRNDMKMRMFTDMKIAEKNAKLEKLRKVYTREKRRLEFNHKGYLNKYRNMNVYDEHVDTRSELYVPLLRHGTNPKYRNEYINMEKKLYKSQYVGVDLLKTMPRWIHNVGDMRNLKLPGTRLCPRETKWTDPVLKKLHEELKALRFDHKVPVNLRVAVQQSEAEPPTPELEACDPKVEEQYQSAVLLQKIIRGRVVQLAIFEGRERCRELINELQSSYDLLRKGKIDKMNQKDRIGQKQFETARCLQNMDILEANLKELGGQMTGTLLDFLNKELKRLIRERKIHAMALVAERERLQREAGEAGRRQKEIRRRKEHDEIFKQVVKVHQETVDLYLQDIITEGMEFVSEEEAHNYVMRLARQVDQENIDMMEKLESVDYTENYIANLVHHFAVPEVEKRMLRERRQMLNKKHLKVAHEEINNLIDCLDPHYKTQEHTTAETSDYQGLGGDFKAGSRVLKAVKSSERRVVYSDVQDILNELVNTPIKMRVLHEMMLCLSSSSGEASDKSDPKNDSDLLTYYKDN